MTICIERDWADGEHDVHVALLGGAMIWSMKRTIGSARLGVGAVNPLGASAKDPRARRPRLPATACPASRAYSYWPTDVGRGSTR